MRHIANRSRACMRNQVWVKLSERAHTHGHGQCDLELSNKLEACCCDMAASLARLPGLSRREELDQQPAAVSRIEYLIIE